MEHILMVLIAGFVLYHFMGGCGCLRRGNGFRVGAYEWSNPGEFIGEDIFKPMAHGLENVWKKESQHLTPKCIYPYINLFKINSLILFNNVYFNY